MNIAELFYPKELKETIADLRAKDDLNEQAIKNLNGCLYLYYLIWIVFSAVIIFNLNVMLALALIFLSFACLVIFSPYICIIEFRNRMASYIYGTKMKAKILKRYTRRTSSKPQISDLRLYVYDISDELTIKHLDVIGISINYLKDGDEVTLCYPTNPVYKPVLYLPEYVNNYCLSKDILKELE